MHRSIHKEHVAFFTGKRGFITKMLEIKKTIKCRTLVKNTSYPNEYVVLKPQHLNGGNVASSAGNDSPV